MSSNRPYKSEFDPRVHAMMDQCAPKEPRELSEVTKQSPLAAVHSAIADELRFLEHAIDELEGKLKCLRRPRIAAGSGGGVGPNACPAEPVASPVVVSFYKLRQSISNARYRLMDLLAELDV